MTKTKKEYPVIVGSKVRLRLIQQKDMERLRRWRNENRFAFFDSSRISPEKQKRWFESYQKKKNDLMFIIETLGGRPIGTVALYKIDLPNKRAEFGRMIIGAVKSRGKGFGWDAAESLIRFAFSTLNLQQLKIEVKKNNQPAIRLYEKIGFRKVQADGGNLMVDRVAMVLDRKAHLSILLSISIAIPTYNEEKNISRCLKSIFKQDYPQKLLEVFVVDGYSSDDTLKIAQEFPVKIIKNKARDAQVGKMMALKKARGELFIYSEADLEWRGRRWLKKMIRPLLEEPEVIGSFTTVVQSKNYSPLARYLSYHPQQCDPIYEFFSPSIKSTIVASRDGYEICQYRIGKIPPTGLCLYRRKELLRTKIGQMKKFMELDNLPILVKAGYDKFAYVPGAGFYHYHVKDLGHLLRKKFKYIENNYLPHFEEREYQWFDLKTKKGILKIIFWVIYANLLIPATIRGIIKTIKYRDIVCMYEPLVTLLTTDAIIFGFLKHPKGRAMIKKMLKNMGGRR